MPRSWPRAAAIPVACALLTLTACATTLRASAGGPLSSQATPSTSASTPAPKPSTGPKATPTQQPANVTRATGHGPAGSMSVTGNKTVALTFDDGPDPVNTPKMLDLLKKNGVHATFCLVGQQAWGNPALVRRIVAEGHTLCNHTWRHRLDLGKQSDAVILKDLQDTNNAIRRAVPNAEIKYFRAPGGNFTPRLVADAASLGMKSIYWSVDTRDWDFKTFGHGSSMVRHVIASVKGSTRPGAIVLSHDYKKPDTLTAYTTLLPWLKARFKLVPLPR